MVTVEMRRVKHRHPVLALSWAVAATSDHANHAGPECVARGYRALCMTLPFVQNAFTQHYCNDGQGNGPKAVDLRRSVMGPPSWKISVFSACLLDTSTLRAFNRLTPSERVSGWRLARTSTRWHPGR